MSTRGRLLKTEDLREFTGSVRRWKREWVDVAGSSAQPEKRMRTVKWMQTDERTTSEIMPRHSEIVAAPTPGGKPQPPLFVRAKMKMKVKLKVPVPPAAGGAGASATAAPSPPPPQA